MNQAADQPIRSVLVLGGGSAGFLTAIYLKSGLPDLDVTLLRSPGIGIIGVGEGTVATVPRHLHHNLAIDPVDFYRQAQPTWKLGIRFIWGPRPFFNYTFKAQIDLKYEALSRSNGYYCDDGFEFAEVASALMTLDRVFLCRDDGAPLIGPDTAYHLENRKFVSFLESLARTRGVVIQDDTVARVRQDEDGIAGLDLSSGATVDADLYVDCSGFRSVLLGDALQEPFISFRSSLFCERAVVGGWDRSPDEAIKPYTTSETMDAGWAWQIEHEHHITRGYVYAPDFISDDEAEQEFRRKNPKLGETRIVRFTSGRYRRPWVKNVVAIGNAGGFVEPLEATSLGIICADAQAVTESLRDCQQVFRPSLARTFNDRSARAWETIRSFLAIHYRFNTRLDTPFWRACQADVDIAGAEPIVQYYQENGPSALWQETLIDPLDQFKLDGYFTLLVGQQVPYQRTWSPPAEERAIWDRIQAATRRQAENSLTCEQALAALRSRAWRWNPQAFK